MIEVCAPALHLGGWFDPFLGSTLRCFTGLRQHGLTETARAGQRLIVGPWVHWSPGVSRRRAGEVDFGPAAEIDFDALRLAWYDHWLKGAATGILDGPPVRVFLMGPDRWLDLSDWPPPQAALQQVYLHSGTGGSAESLNTGLLAFAPPHADEESDSYTYDPVDPVPSLLRYPHTGPYDHRVLEGRMLTYSSPLIERDITVIGPVKVVLYAASSALDTDWVARLCDVHPDGRSMSVCDGILRARYRASFEQAEPLKPGQIYRFEVDLGATAQVFRAGHRLRLEVTSSDFPRYDRNLNTGGVIAEEVQHRVAVNTIFHDASHPSHIGLPVIR